MEAYKSLDDLTKELKSQYNKLSEYELLSLAIQIQRNQILSAGLAVEQSNNSQTGLEAIANALGYDATFSGSSVAERMGELQEALDNVCNDDALEIIKYFSKRIKNGEL